MGCCLVAVAAIGCSGDDIDTGGMGGMAGMAGTSGMGQGGTSAAQTVTFTKDIHPILVMNCGKSGCHDMSGSFIPGHGAADVDVAYMEATQIGSNNAPIYERILVRTGSTDPMFVMPPYYETVPSPCMGGLGTPGCLTQAQYDLIKAWVDDGHPK